MFWNWLLNIVLVFLSVFSGLPVGTNQSWESYSLASKDKAEIVAAPRAAVLSPDGRFLFFDKGASEQQPIASITKLMTALVFLETKPTWESGYEITRADMIEGGRLNFFPGDTVNLRDLFLTSLVASDNGATMALVHATGLSEEEFVARMNEKAKDLRLENTSFADPIGLSVSNVSTAREVAELAQAALARTEISEAVTMPEYRLTTLEGKEVFIESTDHLLFDTAPGELEALGGKTGYTDAAGYCFVGRFRSPTGQEFIAAILNSAGKNERFRESKTITRWVLDNYFSNYATDK